MIDYMRKLEPKTRTAYRFQLYLVDQGTSPITINATIVGLKFFFDVTMPLAYV
jgi:hypothetical protein